MSLVRKIRVVTPTKRVNVRSNRLRINKLARIINQREIKFIDRAVDDPTISQTGTVQTQLFTIPQGDGPSTRDGRKIVLTSMQWQGTVNIVATSVPGEASDTVRMLVLKDKQTNGALPSVTDILVNANWEAFKNLVNKNRFVTLIDKYVSIASMGAFGDGTTNIALPNEKHFKLFRKLNVPIEYDESATTGVIATITTNNIVMLLISRAANAGIESCIRFRYSDM